MDVHPYGFYGLEGSQVTSRMSKGMLLKTVREEIGPARADNLAKLKRAELAAVVTGELNGKWLPLPLVKSALIERARWPRGRSGWLASSTSPA